MNHELRVFGVLLVVFGTGLAMGFANNDLKFSASRQANLASVCFYDEYGNDVCEPTVDYEEPAGWWWEEQTPTDANGNAVDEQVWDGLDSGTSPDGPYFDAPYDPWYDPYYNEDLYYYDSEEPDSIYYDSEEPGTIFYDDYYDEGYSDRRKSNTGNEPWYVSAFPGFGKMAQQIIPGQSYQPRAVTQQAVQPAPQPVVRPAVQPAPVYPQPSCWISAQPTSVVSGGSTLLNWSTFNASQASLTGVGAVPLSGSRTVPNITATRTFTLSVAGRGGSGSCYTRVEVQTPALGAPSCIISAYPNTIPNGGSASLSWGSQNATGASLSGFGPVEVQGGLTVSPSRTTNYVLSVSNASNQSNRCNVLLTVQ